MSERAGRKAARGLLNRVGYKSGGHVKPREVENSAEDKAQDKALAKKMEKRSTGGLVSGAAPKIRLDRHARGGKTRGTNIIIMNGRGAGDAGVPGAAHAPMPMRPPMPGGAGPMMPPPGMPAQPGAVKRGGSIHRASGGSVGKYDAGAESGVGRLEKVKNYRRGEKRAAE